MLIIHVFGTAEIYSSFLYMFSDGTYFFSAGSVCLTVKIASVFYLL
jgi:hypothetical protein